MSNSLLLICYRIVILIFNIDTGKACRHFRNALSLAKTQTDRQTIQKKIDRL